MLNINFFEQVEGAINVDIFETSGRLAGNYTLENSLNNKFQLNVSGMNGGMYIANVTTVNGDLMTYKFIVQ